MGAFPTFPQLLWISLGIEVGQLVEVQQPRRVGTRAKPMGNGAWGLLKKVFPLLTENAMSTTEKSNPDRSPVPSTPARTLNNRPDDANRAGADSSFPPGVDADTARDPGRMTPETTKVDNRS